MFGCSRTATDMSKPIVDEGPSLFVLLLLPLILLPLAVTNTGVKESAKNDEDDDSGQQFIPTSDWQTIELDQSIPPGLHVRLNLQTGVREAKLMDKYENKDQRALVKAMKNGDDNPSVHSMKELKEVLHKINADDETERLDSVVEHSFRSIEEIRTEFDALNVTMRTEAELVSDLLEELRRSAADSDRMQAILQDLEFYVHQYDSAVDFVKLGGLALLAPLLNSTFDNIRSAAAFLLGSAMQSNPSVQVSAADAGFIQKLLNRLAVEPSPAVGNKVLYAVSGLLRRFPHAQRKFLELGGLQIVKRFFDDELGGSDDVRRLQLKTMAMLYDLMIEHEEAQLRIAEMNEEQKLRASQYQAVGIKRAIIATDFCGLVGRSLSKTTDTEPLEYDAIEKILQTMAVIASECRTEFSKVSGRLERLLREYERLADADVGNDIHRTVRSLVNIVGEEVRQKEEL